MSVTPQDILQTATRLACLESQTESDSRATVSRSYYAALHGVNNCLPGRVQTEQKNSHEQVISKADAHGKSLKPGRTEAKEVTRNMYLFKKMRKMADYDIENEFDQSEAQDALSLCASILENCRIIKEKLSSSAL
jgi:uncharacterized protein (UPF0332 family)